MTDRAAGASAWPLVRIERLHTRWKDRLRRYTVILDGTEVGKLRNGEAIELAVAPGLHHLLIKIEFVGSDPIQFAVASGEEAHFVCRATASNIIEMILSLAGNRPWVRLERVG